MTKDERQNDLALYAEVKKGNVKAFEQLFDRHYRQLCQFSMHITGNLEASEELVSDVLANLWLRRDNLNIEKNLKVYLYQSIKNQSINHLNKKEVLHDSLEEPSGEIGLSSYRPDELACYQELQQQLQFLIDQMPPKRRLIFRMSRLEGFTYAEISEILSISVNTVQNQMVAAVKFMAGFKSTFLQAVIFVIAFIRASV